MRICVVNWYALPWQNVWFSIVTMEMKENELKCYYKQNQWNVVISWRLKKKNSNWWHQCFKPEGNRDLLTSEQRDGFVLGG